MMRAYARAWCFALWLMTSIGSAAAAQMTVIDLQRLLQSSAKPVVTFQEVRESPWLAAPITSRGTMRVTPNALEKLVETPRPETWRLLPDRIEARIGTESRQIMFSEVPALSALSDLMRHVVAAEIVVLERDFEIQLSGDQRVWRAQLRPRSAQLARYIEQAELQGSGGQLQVIIVMDRQGGRTTTRLGSSPQ